MRWGGATAACSRQRWMWLRAPFVLRPEYSQNVASNARSTSALRPSPQVSGALTSGAARIANAISFACLKDVSHAQDKAHELSEALSFYTAPKGKAPNPIGKVDPEQIKRWAAQTEVSSGNGYTRRGGRWMVELAAYDNEKDALDLYDRARAAGYAVQIKPRRTKGESQRYAVRIAQVASRTEAAVLAEKLRQRLELGATVVSRQP